MATAQILGNYELLGRLAIGGMGEVFLARQRGTGGFEREVVVKTLLPELCAQPTAVEQFMDEARLAARLNHPNIVSILEVGSENGRYYLAMEHIDGPPLSKLSKHKVTPELAARLIRDAAMGLDHAHRATDAQGRRLELIHRDVSPQNLMLRRDGVLKVVDFGIAKARGNVGRTGTGEVKGKLAYLAPEQLSPERLTQAADQYALGVVFWELLTHRRLFDAENDAAIITKMLEQKIDDPKALEPSVPEALAAICMRMLQRNPKDRYPSMTDVVDRLDAQPLATLQEVADEVAAVPSPKPHAGTETFTVALRSAPSLKALTAGLTRQGLKPGAAASYLLAALVAGALGWGLRGVLRPPRIVYVETAAPAPAPPPRVEPVAAPPPPAAVEKKTWFEEAAPHCNALEARRWLETHPALQTAEGAAERSVCLLMAGANADARRELLIRPPSDRKQMAESVFALAQPLADADMRAATPLLELVLELSPDHPSALYKLGMQNLADRRPEGREQLQRFLKVHPENDPLRAGALAALKR
ncbi:MAG: serine/threonine-protein kinase [Myxococcaceae bacterium]